ncbi:MAG TPA: oxygenase MpaB family protein [Candidatus Binatus sp.]
MPKRARDRGKARGRGSQGIEQTQGWSENLIDQMCRKGDDLADALVTKVAQQTQGGLPLLADLLRNMIRHETIGHFRSKLTDAFKGSSPGDRKKVGELLDKYLDDTRIVPWAEPELIATGQRVFRQNGMIAFAILGCASLPESYATSYGAKVLGITQQLLSHTKRRLWETSLFVINLMQEREDNLQGLSDEGIEAAQKVRLMHAAIRYLIKQQPAKMPPNGKPGSELGNAFLQMRWHEQEWGEPANQVAMSMAILSFSYVVLRSLRKLGVDLTHFEEKAYLHCWNVVGAIMGVDDRMLLPKGQESMEEAQELYERVWLRPGVIARTSEGRALEKALLEYMEDFVPETFEPLRRIPRIITRGLVSSKIAGAIGLRLDWKDTLGLQMLRGLTHAHRFGTGVAGLAGVDLDWAATAFQDLLKAGGLRHLEAEDIDQLPPIRLAAEWLFRRMAEGLHLSERGGDRPPFQIPTKLARHWHIGNERKE